MVAVADARSRLAVAVVASAVLHWVLMYGVTVGAPEPSVPPLIGRLQPEPSPLGESATPTRPSARLASAAPPSVSPTAVTRGAPLVRVKSATLVPPAEEIPAPALPPASDSALPSVAMPLLSDPTWYTADQLDVYPRALGSVRPTYPGQAAAQGIGGDVTLLLMVDERGTVEEVSVVQATPEGHFEHAAVAAFRTIRFEAARKDGRSVRSRIVVRVSFDPASASNALSGPSAAR